MNRLLKLSLLFTLGVLGAWIVVAVTDPAERRSEPTPDTTAQREASESYRAAVRAQLALEDPATVGTLSSRERDFRGALSRGERLEEFRFAVQEMSPESLRSIRTELLSDLPDYRSVILPQLKRWSLEELLFRFSRSDWRDWPHTSIGVGEKPTRAREFVTAVTVVNRDVGVFLETAAHLFHELFQATNQGLPFDEWAGIRAVTDHPESVIPGVVDSDLRARFSLASTVLLDPSFRELFERERCALVGEFLSLRRDTERNVKLIGSLSSEHCSADISGEVGAVLQEVLNNASLRYREALLDQESEVRTLDGFARNDARVLEPLASLYLTTGRELLAEGKFETTRRYLGEAVSLRGSPDPEGKLAMAYRGLARRGTPRRYEVGLEDVQSEGTFGFFAIAALLLGATLLLFALLSILRKRGSPAVIAPTPVVIRPRAEIKEFPKAASLKRG